TLTVTAIARDAVAPSVRLAKLDLGRFELLDSSDADHDLGDGKKSRRFVLQIAAYELGELEIPPIAVEYRGAGGETKALHTTPIPVTIKSLVDDRRWIQGLLVGGAALVAIVLALIVRSIARRRRARPRIVVPERARPPH